MSAAQITTKEGAMQQIRMRSATKGSVDTVFVVLACTLLWVYSALPAWATVTGPGVTLPVDAGWNLLSSTIGFQVAKVFAGSSTIVSVWKWKNGAWAVYLPAEDPPGAYAISKGFGQFTAISAGEGFWVRAVGKSSLMISGTPTLGQLKFSTGWNLMGLISAKPSTLADIVASKPTAASLWKWKNGNWAVYLPKELSPGDYAASKGFGQLETIAPGEGFWVNVPAPTTTTTVATTVTSTTTTTTAVPYGTAPLRTDGPIRVPVSIDLVKSNPNQAIVREVGSWQLPFILSQDIEAGVDLKLQVYGGRNNKQRFDSLQALHKGAPNYITARLADGSRLDMQEDKGAPGTFTIKLPATGLKKGTLLLVTLGDTVGGSVGARVGTRSAFGKFFVLYKPLSSSSYPIIWGEANFNQMVGGAVIDIIGGPIHHIRAYASSNAKPGESFSILVRPEDEFRNLSPVALQALRVFNGSVELASTITEVPGTSTVRLDVVLPQEGTYRLKVVDDATGLGAFANPVLCQAGGTANTYWGMIHGHTEMSDGAGSLSHYFRQIRDEAGLDFAATADHDHVSETSDNMWSVTQSAVQGWNESGRFVAFLGYEWAMWGASGNGDRNVYFLDDNRPLYRSGVGFYSSPGDLFEVLQGERAMVIPHHTALAKSFCDWRGYDPTIERLVEIFQRRGSYECSTEDGDLFPPSEASVQVGFVRRALELGWRVGFTAGGDDHSGAAGTDIDSGLSRRAGLMSVQASGLTREDLWEGLWQRRVVATTGPRMLFNYEMDGFPMGAEVALSENPGLATSRHFHLEFHGTAPVQRIDIIRNSTVIHSIQGQGSPDCDLSWDDTEALPVLGPTLYSPEQFCYYYFRVLQNNGEAAWASPIWIVIK
jgi:hypothetical protein